MSVDKERRTRGRPKTLERDHVLRTALMCYWTDGPTNVSINEICLKTGASKPSVYREFSSDDGLKRAALESYKSLVLSPLYDILASDKPFDQILEALVGFIIQERQALGLPNGCLYYAMRAHRDELGQDTREKVDQLRGETLRNYETMIKRAKSKSEFRTDIPTGMAALYFDTQQGGAMRLQKEGVPNATIGKILKLAFKALR